MRTLTLTIMLAVTVPLAACTAMVGGGETPCAQAVDHLAICGITNLPEIGACTPGKAQRASQIMATACADLGTRSNFSSSSCDSIWSIFNPSCWSDGDNPDGDNPDGENPDGENPDGDDPDKDAVSPPGTGKHTLYLNYNGGDLYKSSYDDATYNLSAIVPYSIHIGPVKSYDMDQADKDMVTKKVQDYLSEFGVNVVDRRPLQGPYTMVMFTPLALPGMPLQAAGVSRKDCGNKNPNNVVFVFTAPLLNALTWQRTHVATTIVHEVGHSYGLDHIKGWNAIMAQHSGELSEVFRTWKTGTVVSTGLVCSSGPTQDSRQVLHDNLR